MAQGIDGATHLWVAARALLSERREDLFRCRDTVLRTTDPEDIHDLRVASRRFREALALFAHSYPPPRIARLIKQVKRITRLLGDIRNTDEAIIFFSGLREEVDVLCRMCLDQLLRSFQGRRDKMLRRLKRDLGQCMPDSLRSECRNVVESPVLFTSSAGGVDPFTPLAVFARGSLDARLDEVLSKVPAARSAGAVEAQHLLRIAVKHYRYRTELLSPLMGASYRELHRVLKGYQDVLGKMHDIDVFFGIVRAAGFPVQAEKTIAAAMATKRNRLFTEFSVMLHSLPLEQTGARIRNAL